MAKLVSAAYGQALFEIAVEENKGTRFLEEAEGIRRVLKENPEFDRMMLHPGISKEEKIALTDEVFRGRISDEMVGFLELIIRKERYRDLQSVLQYFIDKMKEEQKTGIAYVTSAVELTGGQKAQVQKRMLQTSGYLTMEMHYNVDPAIIGGLVIRMNDRVVDSSIRTKLNDLTRQLLQIQLG